jgi:hypothetical protein
MKTFWFERTLWVIITKPLGTCPCQLNVVFVVVLCHQVPKRAVMERSFLVILLTATVHARIHNFIIQPMPITQWHPILVFTEQCKLTKSAAASAWWAK